VTLTKIQQWVAIAAAAIVIVLVAGWFFVVSPQRAKAKALTAQTAGQRGRTAGLRTQLDVLQVQSKEVPAKLAELARFGKQVPSSPLLPALIRSLSVATASAGVDLVSIAPSTPAPLVTATPATTVPSPAVASPGAAAASPAPAASAGAPAAGPSAAAPAPAVSALQAITLALKVNGSYAQLEQFVANLEGLQRVFLVNGYALGPSSAGGKPGSSGGTCASTCLLSLDLTGQVFTTPVLAAAPAPSTVK
jgi:Tfp pilus assembly protein PilO